LKDALLLLKFRISSYTHAFKYKKNREAPKFYILRSSYMKNEYLDDTQQLMLSFLSLSLSTDNVRNILCQVPYKECYIFFFIKRLLL